MALGKGGVRAFFMDQDENICETANAQGYSGADKRPAFDAALQGHTLQSRRCGDGSDGAFWKPWKKKRLQEPASSR